MAYYSGSDGWMYLQAGERFQDPGGSFEPADKSAAVTNWSLTTTLTAIESSTLGDTDTIFTPGLRTTTGACTILYYKDINKSNKAALLINQMIKPRNNEILDGGQAEKPGKVIFKLGLDDEAGVERFIYVRAYLTSVSTAMAVGEVMKVDAQFRVIGAPNQVAIDNSG